MTNIAINGFGRIGRSLLRVILGQAHDDIRVVAINDLMPPAQLLHLLKYDSVLGPLADGFALQGSTLVVGPHMIRLSAQKDLARLDWRGVGADVVVECTGTLTDADEARTHIEVGARKVLISAPADNADITLVYGVNDSLYAPGRHHVVSNASCTTNCLAPLVSVLDQHLGIAHGFMTTVHAYTQDQRLQDGPHKDLRRARSAAENIVPTATGAAKAIGLILPRLAGKLDGCSLRVPVVTGSLVEFNGVLGRDTTAQEINALFEDAARCGPLQGVLQVTHDPIVSSDIRRNPASCVIDASLTQVLGGRHVAVFGWYDNEWGFSCRLADVARLLGKSLT